jgi:glucose-1-phosphate adenylyltransferase
MTPAFQVPGAHGRDEEKTATMRKRILAFIMAGGKGTRLEPLTRDRAKPAVPFGGRYRIIDFVLSNFVNSGVHSIYVLTQFKSQSLTEHIQNAWTFSSILGDQFVTVVPAQMRRGESWYKGTADAIYQNFHVISERNPDIVAVFGGDHIYRMDITQMVQYHSEKNADATISAIPFPIEEGHKFGILEVDEDWRVVGFQEKPAQAKPIPGQPDKALVSMGNYLFNAGALEKALTADADKETSHDFGHDILPRIYRSMKVYAYDFRTNVVPGVELKERGYWRDVGDLDSYYYANMDLKDFEPVFNLYNREWPIRTSVHSDPPAKFVHTSEGRTGHALNSIVSEGCIISGSTVRDCVLGRNVHIHSFSEVTESILMDQVTIGRGCRIRRCIMDKYVTIEPGTSIGIDREADRKKYHVTDSGIVVIARSPKRGVLISELRF